MSTYKVVAINGSLSPKDDNISVIINMLRANLLNKGVEIEEILLSEHDIRYCYNCALCLSNGKCWINDDYRFIMKKTLAADAVITASTEMYSNGTARIKNFVDRALSSGHRIKDCSKPGITLTISKGGKGISSLTSSLANSLRLFNCYFLTSFSSISFAQGKFFDKEIVEAKAEDVAQLLLKALTGGRPRSPALDIDRAHWSFMGYLIKSQKELMKDDVKHWQELELFDSFENYVKQKKSKVETNLSEQKKRLIHLKQIYKNS